MFTALKDKYLPESEKLQLTQALNLHRDRAREMRIGMRKAIEMYAKNFIIGDKTFETTPKEILAQDAITRAVSRTPLFADEPLDTAEEYSFEGRIIVQIIIPIPVISILI